MVWPDGQKKERTRSPDSGRGECADGDCASWLPGSRSSSPPFCGLLCDRGGNSKPQCPAPLEAGVLLPSGSGGPGMGGERGASCWLVPVLLSLQQQQHLAPTPRSCLSPLPCPLPHSTPTQRPERQQAGLPLEARAPAPLSGLQPLCVLILGLQHLFSARSASQQRQKQFLVLNPLWAQHPLRLLFPPAP